MTRPKPLPTYAEIAKKAKLSVKTVCNVFRYPDLVRGKTEAKVLKALRELGVSDPSIMKSRLRPARAPQTQSILLLQTGTSTGAMNSPVFSRIVHAAESRAYELGWQFSLRHKNPEESAVDALRNFGGDGVIVFGNTTSYDEINSAMPGVAVVRLLAPPEDGMDCDNVDYDRQEVSRLAARHLHKSGCKKVAYLGTLDSRGNYFLEAAKHLGLEAFSGGVPDILTISNNTQVVNRAALETSWNLIEAARPDGIFVHSDHIANALYTLLAAKGIRPQHDIQVISCNAEELFLSPLQPRPATIDIHSAEIGRRGVDTLVWRMQNLSAPPSSTIISPKLIPGESA